MPTEANVQTQPETDDTNPLLLKRIAAALHRGLGDIPTIGVDSSNPISGGTCFGVEADADGMIIGSITAPNHTGQSLAGFKLAGGQALDVYFTDLTVSSGRGVAFVAE